MEPVVQEYNSHESTAKSYDARDIANWFVEHTNADENRKGKDEFLSITSLLKLTYIAHGWCLALQQKPLYVNHTEAWQYGPVVPDIYKYFRRQGTQIKKTLDMGREIKFFDADISLLTEIYDVYSKFRPSQLSYLTHVAGGPWDIVSRSSGWFSIIPNELIKQHYDLKRQEAEAKKT